MKKMKHTRRQIQEAIAYWECQLQKNDMLECLSRQLNESAQSDIREITDSIKSEINTPDDVKNFIRANDARVTRESESKVRKVWSILKSIVSKGTAFVRKNWKLVVIIVLAVLVYFKGPMWLVDKIIGCIMWICGYNKGHQPEDVQSMLKASGNCPELEYSDVIDKFNSRPFFDDGTMGTF